MMSSAAIRQQFLDFFKSKEHKILPSAPMVLKNDPTLLFTNAGMNQFKDYFLGNKKSPHPRVANTQKCLRVSGKHNDLEEVGVDTYHHTMFEMLGNWSFGDPENPDGGYFKKEAIAWSWELLTKVYKIPEDRLYVTVFEGDISDHLPKDQEAYDEWKKWIAEDRILLASKKDNFWEMGDTGPCGPCTEIHVDCRSEDQRMRIDGKKLVNNDDPQVIEIWNNVFIQFNRLKTGDLEPLPAKHVDTGMGLERLVRVLQNKSSNYDTDIFSGTIKETESLTGRTYSGGDSKSDIAFRVIADHIRAISFAIADGQLPSNTGAGYVIRRILRRAVRYYYSWLDRKAPLLTNLTGNLATQFEHVFPELKKQEEFVAKVIREEEESFLRTLEKGLKKIEEIKEHAKESGIIDGKAAFELYDTYGFPVDLTRLIAQESDLNVDEKGFESEMLKQKTRSRAAADVDTGDWIIVKEHSHTLFTGYSSYQEHASVTKYRNLKTKNKDVFQLVLDRTPFYAESGGQIGDTGKLIFGEEIIQVTDTKKENDLIIHLTDKLPADIKQSAKAVIDLNKRKETAKHHSATHLLHAALRKVLGNHVTQKGSLVKEDHLRFDFSHFSKMSDEEIGAVERIVNEKIRENISVNIQEMGREEAMSMGAMALFGEKYGETVRVVSMDPEYSVELCGGTHVNATGSLGYFHIIHESAVASGVRRIEAICGQAAEDFINSQLNLVKSFREKLKHPKDLEKSLDHLLEESQEMRKKVESMEQRQLMTLSNTLVQMAKPLGEINFLGEIIDVASADALKKICYEIKHEIPNHVAVLCTPIAGKPFVAISISDELVTSKGLDAGKLIREIVAPLINGGGGGQKTLATAGGQDATKLKDVVKALRETVELKIKSEN